MKHTTFKTICLILLSVTLSQCTPDSIPTTVKLLPNDPFINTITPSQTFEIDSKIDNIVEGNHGTLLVFPKRCFKYPNGEIVEAKVQIELAEALTLDEMILSNLTTTSNGAPLETDGMIFFNAKAGDKQLAINKDNPIFIEIPTNKRKPEMMAYKGTRDKAGNMNWIEPQPLDNHLIPVDIFSLDFLPEGFQSEVDRGMPYKHYETATQGLTDSLYYILSVTDGSSLLAGLVSTNINEPYDNKEAKVVNGQYTPNSYSVDEKGNATMPGSEQARCGIDPARIKVIKTETYQNTLIATKEFQARFKIISKTCDNSILDIYVKNLDKNLFESDSLAANYCRESGNQQYYDAFLEFSKQQLTTVKNDDKFARLLSEYYDKQLAKVKSDLQTQHQKVLQNLQKENEVAQEVVDDYKKLLWKREKYRMEAYGFIWSETGWINIDNGTQAKNWGRKTTEGIYVENGKAYDRVYAYILFTSLKSLYRLNTEDNVEFHAGNEQDKALLMPKQGIAILISIGYKDEAPSMAIKEFELSSPINYRVTLTPSTLDEVREAIMTYEKYGVENTIDRDLDFMAKLYKEEKRQKVLRKESEFLLRLWNISFPCCVEKSDSSFSEN